jgi:WD40-like Beta Propeller Repeat
VRRHSSAASPRSTSNQAGGLGSIGRGTGATRGDFRSSEGTGAPAAALLASRLPAMLALVAAALALWVSPASAAETHPYTGVAFGPDGVGGSASFEAVRSVAVDPGSGDVYVYDAGAGKVYKFDSAGAPVSFSATGTNAIEGVGGNAGGAEFEIAVAPAGSPAGTAGNIYVANNGSAIHVYSAAGSEIAVLDQGGETCGTATDPAGNFYAGIYSQTINKYTPTTNPPTEADKAGTVTAEGVGLCNVAADGLGNVYAANYGGGGLYKLEGIADTSPALVDESARTMGIAPGSNDLYANRGGEVLQYDSSGTLVGSFGSGEISDSRGVAVNSGASRIYVGTPTKVKVFGPLATVPDAITEGADGITRTTADLHGMVGAAGGPDATCVFQYVTESEYSQTGFEGASEKPCAPAGPFTGTSTSAVSATPTGLNPETNYRFRLLATSSNGSNGGAVLGFTTVGAVNLQTDPATDVTDSSATLNGTLNPEGVELDSCEFEYGRTASLTATVPCAESPAEIGSGSSPVSVHADLTGLDGGSEYVFRLVGSNEFGTSAGGFESFATLGPAVLDVSVIKVGLDSAEFKATVNPNGLEGTYRFEYVSEAEYESSGFANATELPAGGQSIGDGTDPVDVAEVATGLTPRTTYHVRVTVTNPEGSAVSEERVFTTYAPSATGLPDGRRYEQASPVVKNGNNIQGANRMVQAAEDGNGVTFFSAGGLPGGVGAQDIPLYLARRGESAWTTQGLLPPAETGPRGVVSGWNEQLDRVFDTNFEPGLENSGTVYALDPSSRQFTTIAEGLPGLRQSYVASSADDSLVAFEEGFGAESSVFVVDRESGAVTPASVLNDGSLPVGGASAGPWNYYDAVFGRGGSSSGYYTEDAHVLSDDGSRLYFSSLESGQLYLRKNPSAAQSPLDSEGDCSDPSLACTVEVSASQAATPDPNGLQPTQFVGATPDGSLAFFLSRSQLTDDATTGPNDEGRDLYRYDAETGQLTDLVPDEADEAGAEVQAVVGFSEDGSHVYFVANAVLAPGATPGSCSGSGQIYGQCNLYDWHDGEITFIARLNPQGPEGDTLNWQPTSGTISEEEPTGRVTPDGRILLFSSILQQTDYDNAGRREIYRYDASTSTTECVSCNPANASPTDNASLTAQVRPEVPPIIKASFRKRNLSTSGNRVFFDTSDALLPSDTNGVNDVYEWEASGTGSCNSTDMNGGCLYLISTGTSPLPSYFADASGSGADVFFFTTQPLVGQDQDELVDVYDARINGGLSAQNPESPVPCSSAEACHSPVSTPPQSSTPATATYSGPGNAQPKKHRKKRRHHRKHKKHHKHKHQQHKSGRGVK